MKRQIFNLCLANCLLIISWNVDARKPSRACPTPQAVTRSEKATPHTKSKPVHAAARGIIDLKQGQDLAGLIAKHKNVILYFYGNKCEPCKAMAPELEKVIAEYPHVTVIKINTSIDEFIMHQVKYKVQGIPSLILFKDGKEITPVRDPRDNTMRLYYGGMRKADELRTIFDKHYR